MKQHIKWEIPPENRWRLTYDGKPVETDKVPYAFWVPPVPTVCFVEAAADHSKLEVMLAAHKRFPTMEELTHIKSNLFYDSEAVVYALFDTQNTTGILPDPFRNPLVDGQDKPYRSKITLYQAPADIIPDFTPLIQRLQFTGNNIVVKSRTICGKTCKVIYSPQVLAYGQLQKIAAEHFSDAIMFHTDAGSINNTSNLYFIWSASDFPELKNFLG